MGNKFIDRKRCQEEEEDQEEVDPAVVDVVEVSSEALHLDQQQLLQDQPHVQLHNRDHHHHNSNQQVECSEVVEVSCQPWLQVWPLELVQRLLIKEFVL